MGGEDKGREKGRRKVRGVMAREGDRRG